MARIRTIKPEFFTSEQIVECSTSARLAFVGLLCFCDDRGVHPASVKRFKMEVFPGDALTDDAVQSLVDELIANGLVAEFEAENQRFWHVTGWKKHQRIDRPTFKYPDPSSPNSTTIRRTLDESSTSPRDGMEWNGMEDKYSGHSPDCVSTESGQDQPEKPKRSRAFQKPTVDEIESYCRGEGLKINPQEFFDHFESNGWKVGGKAPMKDWRAAARNWSRRNFPSNGNTSTPAISIKPAEQELAERRQITGGKRL